MKIVSVKFEGGRIVEANRTEQIGYRQPSVISDRMRATYGVGVRMRVGECACAPVQSTRFDGHNCKVKVLSSEGEIIRIRVSSRKRVSNLASAASRWRTHQRSSQRGGIFLTGRQKHINTNNI